ncbi:hypothetical protein [Viridibacterium curvum]
MASHFLAVPCVKAEGDHAGSFHIERRWLFRRGSQTLQRQDIASAELVETKDSEGAPYFSVRAAVTAGWSVEIAEGSDKAQCEQVLKDFEAALD